MIASPFTTVLVIAAVLFLVQSLLVAAIGARSQFSTFFYLCSAVCSALLVFGAGYGPTALFGTCWTMVLLFLLCGACFIARDEDDR